MCFDFNRELQNKNNNKAISIHIATNITGYYNKAELHDIT